jgi:hypothetical protein
MTVVSPLSGCADCRPARVTLPSFIPSPCLFPSLRFYSVIHHELPSLARPRGHQLGRAQGRACRTTTVPRPGRPSPRYRAVLFEVSVSTGINSPCLFTNWQGRHDIKWAIRDAFALFVQRKVPFGKMLRREFSSPFLVRIARRLRSVLRDAVHPTLYRGHSSCQAQKKRK